MEPFIFMDSSTSRTVCHIEVAKKRRVSFTVHTSLEYLTSSVFRAVLQPIAIRGWIEADTKAGELGSSASNGTLENNGIATLLAYNWHRQ